jgi:peptidoglycan/LPS O-acetylase OafA/YrhL
MNSAHPTTSIGENESIFLDVVRLASAQLVFFGHLSGHLYGNGVLIGGRIQIQNLGVVIFFMLSGYLICGALAKYTNFAEFFIDRLARIYVTLVPCLVVIAILDGIAKINGKYGFDGAYDSMTWIGNLLMLQDHPLLTLGFDRSLLTSFGSARPLWTLAVEWWLYMFAGYICLAQRPSLPIVAILAVVPAVFASVGRGQGLTIFWFLGAAMLYVRARHVKEKQLLVAGVASCALYLARLAVSKNFYDVQANIFLAVLAGTLLIWSRRSTRLAALPPRVKRLLRTLSGASFALYILHYSVIELLFSLGMATSRIGLLAFAASNVLAVLIYLLFDRNHKKLGARLRQAWLHAMPKQTGKT